MSFRKLRKARWDVSDPNLPPEVHNINDPRGIPDPRFRGRQVYVGDNVKMSTNLKHDMALLDRYVKGDLKTVGWDKVCGQCLYFYRDPNLRNKKHGRCRAYGFKEVHEELTAEVVDKPYTEPDGQFTFPSWPGCPTWSSRDRLSRK